MNPLNLMLCPAGTCSVAQKFGDNATPIYIAGGDKGHPGWDIHCGYGSPIEAPFDMYIYSVIAKDGPLLGPEGYTQVGAIVETPLETFEWITGHCDPTCQIGPVTKGTVIATEANHGPVFVGNTQITLQMQQQGDHDGSHRHYQKRPLIKVAKTGAGTYLNAYGYYRDAQGNFYQVYMPGNGYNGCSDWMAPLFNRDLFVGRSGYDVYLLQKALILEGFATFAPTGNFGPLTVAAVTRYQLKNTLTPTAGYCGPKTRAVLNAHYFQLPQ
jgi:hypothetical protein